MTTTQEGPSRTRDHERESDPSTPSSAGGRTQSTTAYIAAAVVAVVLVALPFLAVQMPPSTDLPQQVAQLRLFEEALDDPGSPYRVQWLAPNKLGLLPLWVASWWVSDPIDAGRFGLILIAAAWAVGLAWVAKTRRRGAWTTLVAMLFFFSHALGWGLLNHLVGLPVFLFWWCTLERLWQEGQRTPTPVLLRLGLAGLLLYAAHILWLAAGLATLGVHALGTRWPSRRWVLAALALAPTAVLVALWYPSLVVGGFDSVTAWGGSPWFRLHPGWLINSALGGLQGTLETWLLVGVLAWCALALWQNRGSAGTIDRRLMAVAGGFLLAALVLPNVFQRTVFFASRWVPVAMVFAVLAMPSPRLAGGLRTLVAALLLACLTVPTTAAWQEHEDEELAGLGEALAALPESPRLLGLDFVRVSERVQGFPYYHLYVWGQVSRGGEVARSFANEASSLVVYRDLPRDLPWTEGLDWTAHKVRRSDIPHFTHVLIQGTPETLGRMLSDPRLVPVTPPNRWTLLQVVPAPSAAPPSAPPSPELPLPSVEPGTS